MNRWSQETLRKVAIALIGLVVGLMDFLAERPNGHPDFVESLYKAFAVAALLFIAELVLEIRDVQKHDKETYTDFIRRNRNLTGALLAQLHSELDRSIKVRDDEQFVVDHETLAILSYDTFWKLLVEKTDTHKPWTVKTIHSCAIDVWMDHPLTNSLMNRQREFCEGKKGKIIRIICDRAPEPTEEIRKAAQKMADAGIEVRYYDLGSRKIADHNFSWDFAFVDDTEDTAVWDSFASLPGGVIDEAIYINRSQYKGKNLKELWARVDKAAKDITGLVRSAANPAPPTDGLTPR